MSSSKSSHLLQVLKATLSQVESSSEWPQDDSSVVELKRILLARIGDLELLSALAAESPLPTTQPAATYVSDLPPHEVVATDAPMKEAKDTNPKDLPPIAGDAPQS
jgi:hypothetical protein